MVDKSDGPENAFGPQSSRRGHSRSRKCATIHAQTAGGVRHIGMTTTHTVGETGRSGPANVAPRPGISEKPRTSPNVSDVDGVAYQTLTALRPLTMPADTALRRLLARVNAAGEGATERAPEVVSGPTSRASEIHRLRRTFETVCGSRIR